MRAFIRDNGLSIVAFALFAITLGLMAPVGWVAHNAELASHHQAQMTFGTYLASGEWWEAVFENFESEFLQMGLFVWLTAVLYQRGSAESNDPDEREASAQREAEAYARARRPGRVAWLEEAEEAQTSAGGGGGGPVVAPWPVRRGGWLGRAYAHSLSLAMMLLFALSFLAHAKSGAAAYSAEQITHGDAPIGMWAYMATPRFWFESLQNWQSEFLAVFAIVVLSIFLREKYSAQSKPVAAPHDQTGPE